MVSLAKLQKEFIAAIQRKSHEDKTFFSHIRPQQLSAANHLAIYRNSVIGTLQKTLQEIYPVCYKLVGHNFFIFLATEFINIHSSQSPNLAHYGETLATFIEQFTPANSLPYLADVARLEWAYHVAFSAEQPLPVDWQKLSELPKNQEEQIIFTLPPQSTLLQSSYPLDIIWSENQENGDFNNTIHLTPNQHYYFFIWQKNLMIHIDCLTNEQYQALYWVNHGLSLGKICARIESDPTSKMNIIDLIPELIQRQWITGFRLEEGIENETHNTNSETMAMV